MAPSNPLANWERLGDSFYRKVPIYDAVFDECCTEIAAGDVVQRRWDLDTPVAVGNAPRSLHLCSVPAGEESDVYIRLAMFTTGEAGTISGSFVDGWTIEIDLVPLKT